MNQINSFKIIEESKAYRVAEYIDYFFKNIANMPKNEKAHFVKHNDESAYISIVKDRTSRLIGKNKGKLMEKAWRNCIFVFIDKSTYKNYFGTNSNYYEFDVSFEDFIFQQVLKTDTKVKYPDDIRIHWKIINTIQNAIFNKFKSKYSSWFVRSYVYITLILCDEISAIKPQDFQIYYWNTNYQFKKVNGKQSIFHNTSHSYFVENINNEFEFIESNNKDLIDCVNAYTGNLDFKNDTEHHFIDIKKDIDNGIEFVLVEGTARSGKTIIAMRLLGEFSECILLIMNYYFYLALFDAFKILDVKFPESRIFHHSLTNNQRSNGGWIRNLSTQEIIPNLRFLIVDECQRLADNEDYDKYDYKRSGYRRVRGIKEITQIINYPDHKHTVFLGDDLQRLNPKHDNGLNEIYNRIKDKSFRHYQFKKTVGIPPEILTNIRYLLDTDNKYNVCPTNKFEISIANSIESFGSKFYSDSCIKKHFVGVGLQEFENDSFLINNRRIIKYPAALRDSDFPFFLNEEIKNKYILSTYQVISREIESVYLYISDKITYDVELNKIGYKNDVKASINEYIYNHLYTIMTRATLKLTVYCDDSNLREYFLNRLDDIKRISEDQDNVVQAQIALDNEDDLTLSAVYDSFDYDLFIAYHGTNSPLGSFSQATELCDFLESKGFSIFLNNYSCNEEDDDLGFNETTNAIQRSRNFLLVFNDNIPRDNYGMISRKYEDGKPNQLYKELKCFDSMVDLNKRTNRDNLRFYYTGTKLNTSNIYNFLNQLYQEGTYGNSNCCIFSKSVLETWVQTSLTKDN